mgnify:CR=1 FL=1
MKYCNIGVGLPFFLLLLSSKKRKRKVCSNRIYEERRQDKRKESRAYLLLSIIINLWIYSENVKELLMKDRAEPPAEQEDNNDNSIEIEMMRRMTLSNKYRNS